ncbi:MAG: hypothetical protein MZV49_06205 [Rhodopseudomonas palustris]|nr:hypothetical protein [Rhodopseudomonas palustris]
MSGYRTDGLRGQPLHQARRRRRARSTTTTSLLRTIELILGLPPMNQFDAAATPIGAVDSFVVVCLTCNT